MGVCQNEPEAAIDSQANDGFRYTVFGLRIASALALPELTPLAFDGSPPDVRIERASLPERLPGAVDIEPLMQVAGDQFQLNAPAGRFAVRGGRLIEVDAWPGASDRDVRLYLLGTVLGALCHQRSLLPLHAMAMAMAGDEAAAAFAGPSGAGKSTLAALFQSRGASVLADDLCVVDRGSDGAPRAWPGLARIKLWPPGLALAGLAISGLAPIGDHVDKYSLPVRADLASLRALPLTRIYILRPGESEQVEIHALSGPAGVAAVIENIFRWPLAVAMGAAPSAFAQVIALAARCQILELRFTHDAAAPFKVLESVQKHWSN